MCLPGSERTFPNPERILSVPVGQAAAPARIATGPKRGVTDDLPHRYEDVAQDFGFSRLSMRALAFQASERPMRETGTTPCSSTMTTEVEPFDSTIRTLESA